MWWVRLLGCFTLVLIFCQTTASEPYHECVCVPYFQCFSNNTIKESGEGIIDIRIDTETGNPLTPNRIPGDTSAQTKTCGHYLEACCTPPKQEGGGGGNFGGEQPPNNLNGQYPVNGGGINGAHRNRGCGYRNPQGIGFRITGNENGESQFGEFPWMIAIIGKQNLNGAIREVYACGGSLIHRRVVLTTAHCVANKAPQDLFIRAGEWDTQTRLEPLPHQDRPVSIVAIHPAYTAGALYNDFALLILDTPVDLADNVEIICLPDEGEIFYNSRCFATGWGKDQFGDKGRFQVILKSVELPLVPKDRCQSALRTTRLGSFFRLHESFMCAGGEAGIDTCTGDGGSPLVCPIAGETNRYFQVGAVAWGIGCGLDKIPGVYADITKARRWIDATVASYNIDSNSYLPEESIRVGEGQQYNRANFFPDS